MWGRVEPMATSRISDNPFVQQLRLRAEKALEEVRRRIQPQVATPLPGTTVVFRDVLAPTVQPLVAVPKVELSRAELRVLAERQASSPLWGRPREISQVENPLVAGEVALVIPFSSPEEVARARAEMAAAAFDHSDGAAYDLALPKNAMGFGDEERLFVAGLVKKGEQGQPLEVQRRAVVVGADGRLRGAECRTPAEVQALVERSSAMAERIRYQAFGRDVFEETQPTQVRFREFQAGRDSSYTVQVDRLDPQGQLLSTESVRLNNFGMPVEGEELRLTLGGQHQTDVRFDPRRLRDFGAVGA